MGTPQLQVTKLDEAKVGQTVYYRRKHVQVRKSCNRCRLGRLRERYVTCPISSNEDPRNKCEDDWVRATREDEHLDCFCNGYGGLEEWMEGIVQAITLNPPLVTVYFEDSESTKV